MNLPLERTVSGSSGNAGGVGIGVPGAPSAHFSVGAVGFGPSWQDDEPSLRAMYDVACASIIRLEQENQELRAESAVAEQERAILVRELERLREMVADERARDAACAEKCRDKAAADGGWGNI